jgi:hypothetical protein
MTDEEIMNNVLEDNSESSTPPIIRTIRHDDAMSAFNTCYKWTEENNVQAEYILTLKRFQEKGLKWVIRIKDRRRLTFLFAKMQ